ncbi:phospholipase D family protein [Erysipelothrix rhusiopathiae]|nr:phospholipase D family protein [Erysipelothrix rhusiopathiae]
MIINQPFNNQLGNILIEDIKKGYSEIHFFSAFAKIGAVLKLSPYFKKAKEEGTIIKAFIGIDLNNTSYDALTSLYYLCDELFIVHVQNPRITFHTKMYTFFNADKCGHSYIGSNNLTVGGLWLNFETAIKYEIKTDDDKSMYDKYIDLFTTTNSDYAVKITSLDQIDQLLIDQYISKESDTIWKINNESKTERKPIFKKVKESSIPELTDTLHTEEFIDKENLDSSNQDVNHHNTDEIANKAIEDNIQIWFQTKAMTGGSGNILDLSKRGTLVSGSAKNTSFEIQDIDSHTMGGVFFFDINPETDISDTSSLVSKDITINYLGVDYYPATVKIHNEGENPNGSWRIQLKGEDHNKNKLSKFNFKQKILIFNKIYTDYYYLSILEDTPEILTALEKKSVFVSRNGRRSDSKKYGIL